MGANIEVRIGGRGRVRDGVTTADAAQKAHCDLCGADTDAVASTSLEGGAPFACKACLRGRLEAMTVGAWQLRQEGDSFPGVSPAGPAQGLPWGKVSG